MKILVIGSTGPQGREFVAQALAAGHAVCAFARNPAALQPAPGLEVLRGDVFDQRSLDAAARGQDAAVSMLGVSLAAARRPTNVFSQGTRNLNAALASGGLSLSGAVQRLRQHPRQTRHGELPVSAEAAPKTKKRRRYRRLLPSSLFTRIFVDGRRVRIPRQSGQGFRFDVGHRSDLIPATIPK